MNGKNYLYLCQSEMQVALQEYLDKRLCKYSPTVTNVKQNQNDQHQFIIELVSREGANSTKYIATAYDVRNGTN